MRQSALWLILPVALLLVLWPVPAPSHRDPAYPAYDVWVVGYPDHHPLAGVEVTLKYGLDDPQTLTSNAEGHVRFQLLTRTPVKTPPGTTNFATIKAVGRGYGLRTEEMSWAEVAFGGGERITLYPFSEPAAAAGQHPASN
jgi:hypothetical protein